jgi:hypothetical protein
MRSDPGGVTVKNGTDMDPKQPPPNIPFVCQYWCYLDHHLPAAIYVGKFNVTLTIVSAITLTIVRYILEYGLVQYHQWPYNSYITKNAAASAAAIVHSVQLVPALVVCFVTNKVSYNPSQKMSDAPDLWWQQTVQALIQFCTGYMMYDGLVNIIWLKSQMLGTLSSEDYLFLGHHVATILYMTSTRTIGAGHQSAMICMLLGEITNPLHNLYYIGVAAQTLPCCNGVVSQFLFHWIEYLFAMAYVLVRAVIGPFVFVHLTYNLWTSGRRHIPISLLIMWTMLIWGVVLGSIPWIQECGKTIQKYSSDPSQLAITSLFSTSMNEVVEINTEL